MSYTKQNFQSGEVLLASQLNSMDEQISNNDTQIEELKQSQSQQIVELQDDVTVINNKIISLYDTLTVKGKFINAEGYEYTSANHNHSDFIKLKAGDKVSYRLRGSNTTVSVLAFYNEQKLNKDNLIGNILGVTDKTDVVGVYNVEVDCYLVVTNRYDYNDGYLYLSNHSMPDNVKVPFNALSTEIKNDVSNKLDTELSELDDIKKAFEPINLANKDTSVDGEDWNTQDGKLVPREKAGWSRFNPIKVKPNTAYTVSWLYGACKTLAEDGETLYTDGGVNNIYFATSPFTFTTGPHIHYLALFGATSRKESVMLVEGTELPKHYIPNNVKDIPTIQANKLYGVKWCAFGDSLTDSVTLKGQATGEKNYVDYVTQSLGLITTNCGVGGTGYMKTANNFVSRVNTIPTDTEVITVFGSFNDYDFVKDNLGQLGDTGTDTLYGCMYEFLNALFTRCPNVSVGIITPTPWSWESDWNTNINAVTYTNNYVNALIDTARKWSIPVLDLYHESNLRPWVQSFKDTYYRDDNKDGVNDGVHPLDPAHKKFIAPKVEDFIKKLYNVYD